jgi:hypothetical protein
MYSINPEKPFLRHKNVFFCLILWCTVLQFCCFFRTAGSHHLMSFKCHFHQIFFSPQNKNISSTEPSSATSSQWRVIFFSRFRFLAFCPITRSLFEVVGSNPVRLTKAITGSRCGSAVKWWNKKTNKIKRSRVCSPARATFFI